MPMDIVTREMIIRNIILVLSWEMSLDDFKKWNDAIFVDDDCEYDPNYRAIIADVLSLFDQLFGHILGKLEGLEGFEIIAPCITEALKIHDEEKAIRYLNKCVGDLLKSS